MSDDLALELDRFEEMRRFYLVQLTGGAAAADIVATGVVFPEPNDKVVLGWLTKAGSLEVFDSLDGLLEKHEVHGETEIVFPTDLDST